MTIDEATRNYFNTVVKYDSVEQVKYLIESWLSVNYKNHDIDIKDYIYNRSEIVDEFYNEIYGKDKTTI
jgi:hypothetical protein